jgi:hypothetical protein
MQHKACAVDGVPPFHHLAFVIREDEVGYLDLRKVNRHWIGPIQAWMLRVTDGQVPGKTIVKTLQRKSAAGPHQPLFQMPALCSDICEFGDRRKNQAGLRRVLFRTALNCELLDRVLMTLEKVDYLAHTMHLTNDTFSFDNEFNS